ncbi:MAG TPA: TonB-dependent receptor [Chitinophagaceae bacterium]|nr:TonB-dependent receptor [Chitinophagaceae bacterium]
MRKLLVVLISLILYSFSADAQKIAGVIKDEQGKGLDKTTISLLRSKDSSVVKFFSTGSDGKFEFTAVAGKYLLSASHIGYTTWYSAPFELGADKVFEPVFLSKSATQLQGVTVTAQKPIVEVKADKTILNVEGTINATGNDALELLRKSPGVLVDKDENLSLAGKTGVQVYIDGKPTPLSGTDLSNYLKSLQSNQIEAIEIITNPSAKYDAAGNAGIINIRLKKNKSFGTNGSVNAGYNIGIYGKYNGGINLNHRNKNINVFGNYNYNHSLNESRFFLYRQQLDTIFDGRNTMQMRNNSHGFKTGLDYFINKKSTIGVLINGNIGETDMAGDSRTPITYKPTGITNRLLDANNRNQMDRTNLNFNLNYRYTDTAGRELNLDADYGLFRLKSNQLQPNTYRDPSGSTILNQFIYRFIAPTDIDIYTLKGDYEQNFKKGRLGAGFKTSFINTNNNFARYDITQMNPELKQLDVARSNHFDYTENVNALYLNYNRQLKGVMFQAGLRMENTHSRGDSYGINADGSINKNSKLSFERRYTDLFPSAALTFNKNPKNQWGLSYSRRIDRPAYQDLNPFEFKMDEYTYQKGNTLLRPQYTNIVTLTNTYKYKLNTSLSYSHVADVFTQLVDTTEKSKSFITKKNLATQDVIALNISYPFMYKAYTLFVNLSSNYSHFKADFGGGNRTIDLDVFSFNIFMQHSLKFGKKKQWTAEAGGWYNSPSIWQGTFESRQLWSMDAGLQKQVFRGKGTFKVSVSDVFFSMKWKGESNFAGQKTIASGNWESRQLRTSLVWRFGNSQVKAARQRKDASEDEKKRTQGGGGLGQQ